MQHHITKWHKRITDKRLLNRLEGLPLKLAGEYLSEVTVEGHGKFNALCMENDNGGYQVSAHVDKCIGAKGLTRFPAKAEDVTAFVFPNMFDFLTWLHLHGQKLDEEMIVYHGNDLVNACADYILQRPEITRVIHFKHMHRPGIAADGELAFLLEAAPITYGTVEHLYTGHKDLSEAFSIEPQAIRAALKTDLSPKTFYEPLMRSGNSPKLKP